MYPQWVPAGNRVVALACGAGTWRHAIAALPPGGAVIIVVVTWKERNGETAAWEWCAPACYGWKVLGWTNTTQTHATKARWYIHLEDWLERLAALGGCEVWSVRGAGCARGSDLVRWWLTIPGHVTPPVIRKQKPPGITKRSRIWKSLLRFLYSMY